MTERAPPWSRWFVRVGVTIVALLATLSLSTAMFFLAPAVSRLSDDDARAGRQRQELLDELAALRRAQEVEQVIEDCRTLYLDDVLVATGLSELALTDLFVSALGRQPPLTDEERIAQAADNQRLRDILENANVPLRAALTALEKYNRIDPPPVPCPHPAYRDG